MTSSSDGTSGSGPTASGAAGSGAHPGSLSEEALKLAETLQGWISAGAAMTGAGTASECKVCPLCQAIAMMKTARPEVLAHLTEAGLALVSAVRAATEGADGAPHPGSGGGPAEYPTRPSVQRIDVT